MPSIADGRDILLDILNKKWEISITLFEIISNIPTFIVFLLSRIQIQKTQYYEETKKYKNKIYGKFHIGEKYDINDWMTMSSSGIFLFILFHKAVYQCQEFPSDDLPPRQLYMVVSESAFLLLQPDEKRKNQCVLIIYATLYSLQKIERDLDTPNKIIFYWHRPANKAFFSFHLFERIYLNKNYM